MTGTLRYYWSKLIKRLPGTSIKNSAFEYPSKAEPRSNIINSSFGCYSYCGYNCTIINTTIGRFCSIADDVSIGLANHPLRWVSTSPAFYIGKDSIPKDLAVLKLVGEGGIVNIGNDVWIANDVNILQGVNIGNGAVIGTGAVVTSDVPDYAVVGGVPAKIIKYRFDNETIERLMRSEWWNYEPDRLKVLSKHMDDVGKFLEECECGHEDYLIY